MSQLQAKPTSNGPLDICIRHLVKFLVKLLVPHEMDILLLSGVIGSSVQHKPLPKTEK